MRIEGSAVQGEYGYYNEQNKNFLLPESISFSTSNLTGRKEMNVMLEKRFENMETDVSQLKVDVTQLKTDVTELKSDVTQLKTDVTELKSDVTQLKTDVTELKSDVTQLKSDVKELKSDVTQLKTDVTELKIDVGIIKKTYATKADIESVKVLIHNEIASVNREMSSIHKALLEKIASQTKWMVTIMFGFSGIIIAAMKLMLPS
ncbi:hypothetical protein [Xenorhabdus innexi]|uniref:Alpha-fucosyltransferase n=1 Tax=Xenorhabdus innexi TaxID=290109 RepID=A0A1N6MVX2_9GAMM|nr:hypothetical protein [Xenorhabdus innexi]PHM38345.1 putative alpha -fucosyltransferase [Xenorhabdus innexi]SIP72889.1 hypothetical protein XIS1_1680126 [Xenorhabdus innexi]